MIANPCWRLIEIVIIPEPVVPGACFVNDTWIGISKEHCRCRHERATDCTSPVSKGYTTGIRKAEICTGSRSFHILNDSINPVTFPHIFSVWEQDKVVQARRILLHFSVWFTIDEVSNTFINVDALRAIVADAKPTRACALERPISIQTSSVRIAIVHPSCTFILVFAFRACTKPSLIARTMVCTRQLNAQSVRIASCRIGTLLNIYARYAVTFKPFIAFAFVRSGQISACRTFAAA